MIGRISSEQNNNETETTSMNNQFDELTKGLAQSVTRRGALKKFGVGLAGMALACFGLANKAQADPKKLPGDCMTPTNPCCCNKKCRTALPSTHPSYVSCAAQCGFWCL
jgi:hypothetical protein